MNADPIITFEVIWRTMQDLLSSALSLPAQNAPYARAELQPPVWSTLRNALRPILLGPPNPQILEVYFNSLGEERTAIDELKVRYLTYGLSRQARCAISRTREAEIEGIPKGVPEFDCSNYTLEHA